MINWLPGATVAAACFAFANRYTWQGAALVGLAWLYIRAWRAGR